MAQLYLRIWLPAAFVVAATSFSPAARSQDAPRPAKPTESGAQSRSPANPNPAAAALLEKQELQRAIDSAENDRAALVRNLEEFLKKYPESSQRSQIYRAIVESSLQLQDYPRAMNYTERMVSLKPDDASITLLSIQLLERYGDAAGWARAISYCTRVMDQIERAPITDKSPHVSQQDWENEKRHNKSSLLLVRGRLYQKTNDLPDAMRDLQASYALTPSAAAAQRLGEIAESKKDANTAILEYARAFALADGTNGTPSRIEMRRKVGNVWRLAHGGSEDGLGDYLLHTIDDVAASTAPPKTARNAGRKDPYDFILRKADGSPFPLADTKGKIVVLNFWATWCGPCREMEPHFERMAARFSANKDVLFYAMNCDEDESLVANYLQEEKPKVTVLFADGLESALRIDSFPTTVILDRSGKIAFRKEGFDPDTVDKVLAEAVERVSQGGQAPPPDSASISH